MGIQKILSSCGSMVMWKHYVILFGGFIDVGVRSESINNTAVTWLMASKLSLRPLDL